MHYIIDLLTLQSIYLRAFRLICGGERETQRLAASKTSTFYMIGLAAGLIVVFVL